MSKWISVEERLPNGDCEERPLEIEVIGYNKDWIHPDFNPNGTRICWHDDLGWHGARFNGSHDSYIDFDGDDEGESNPTHWHPMVQRPII